MGSLMLNFVVFFFADFSTPHSRRSFFTSFAGYCLGFIPVGKGFGKAFRIVGLDQSKPCS